MVTPVEVELLAVKIEVPKITTKEMAIEPVWKEAVEVLRVYVDSLNDRCVSWYCLSFLFAREFYKTHLEDIDREQVSDDVWLCIYYCELFLIEIYILFQQADLVDPLIKKFTKLVKLHYEKVTS